MFKFNHAVIEKNVILMAVLTLITVSIGGLVQIIPLFTIESTIERVDGVRPYSPLELAGRQRPEHHQQGSAQRVHQRPRGGAAASTALPWLCSSEALSASIFASRLDCSSLAFSIDRLRMRASYSRLR